MLLPPEHVPNLGKVKQLLKAYHDYTCKCGCYATELNEQERRAMAFLEKRARAQKRGEKLALVLDIDETALSNYSFYETTDMGRIQNLFDPWVDSAQAPAIEGTLRLSQKARALRVDVFFISGHIILNVGDQLSDLSGEPAAELSVKLPNPFYFIP